MISKSDRANEAVKLGIGLGAGIMGRLGPDTVFLRQSFDLIGIEYVERLGKAELPFGSEKRLNRDLR